MSLPRRGLNTTYKRDSRGPNYDTGNDKILCSNSDKTEAIVVYISCTRYRTTMRVTTTYKALVLLFVLYSI